MMLNDDCLIHLLKFFNVRELISIRGTCTRLDTLIEGFRHKFVHFDFDSLPITILVPSDYFDILMFVGPSMKSLKINGFYLNDDEYLIFGWIFEFCKKIESLHLDEFRLNLKALNKLAPVVQHLTSLSFGAFNRVTIRDNKLGDCLRRALNLKELNIYGNIRISGECLSKISKLTSLNVSQCRFLQSELLKKALMKNTTLKELDIGHCWILDDSVASCIVNYLKELEKLSFSIGSITNYCLFGNLPNLKKVHIYFYDDSPLQIDLLLERLAERNILEELHLNNIWRLPIATPNMNHISKMTKLKTLSMKNFLQMTDAKLKPLENLRQLESLSISGAPILSAGAYKITENSLLSLFSACVYLKYLDVSHSNVDSFFLKKIIHLIWQQSEYRPKLEMVVEATNIKRGYRQIQCLLKESSKFLKLSFGSTNVVGFADDSDDETMNDQDSDDDFNENFFDSDN